MTERIPAKKSLGQNFLTSKKAIEEIIGAGELSPTDTVLEIGPGKGVLTEELLAKSGKVIAVEKDDRLIDFLKGKFSKEIGEKRFELVHGDALKFNPADLKLQTGEYKLIANIPYYITGAFLKKFLSETIHPSHMVLLVQKEVAERIVARDKKESILSISVKVYGEPKYIDTVKAGSFVPAPTVDSAIISISGISKKFFENKPEEAFFELLKAGFAGKRKMLANNLKRYVEKQGITPENQTNTIKKALEISGIPEKARAEDILLSDWRKLYQNLNNQ